jgi:ubiquinone/menaquinone biosynthesis C-methylase UbiE
MGAPSVHHPLFARIYAALSPCGEKQGQGEHRRDLLAGLSGRVVEVGAGNGLNFAYYPSEVTEVVAVEPEAYLRSRAEEAAARAGVNVAVVDGLAGALPLEDGSADAAVASLVLCSVPDQTAALAELRRVLRPGGELRFYEHVRSDDPRAAAVQQRLDDWGIWPRMVGGCHVARDTGAAIEAAGFTVERSRQVRFPPGRVGLPHILGVARRA